MSASIEERAARFGEDFVALRAAVASVIVGHAEVVEGVLTSLYAGGHCLLEGVPGLGKTLLVRSLSDALDLSFSRVQFTPDLMPADITGTNVIVETEGGKRSFDFQRGPVFANLVLADEVNRATPKTQSALLEAMQEHAVTAQGTTMRLAEPFFVLATQNPIEHEG
ncbi:MAG TPA: AAA family ATPase, partial [Planctomycetota bacterium]|nr:AAA family ATPase [Planctomycetota bacterium]